MAGSKVKQQQQKKNSAAIATTLSSTSYAAVLNVLKLAKRPSRKVEDSSSTASSWDDSLRYKVWPSDEDRGRYVAKPGIDREASIYIANNIRAMSAQHNTAET